MNYDVVIIGAGLAGSSAAIQLAQAGLRVLLLEQSRYPVHKLCGEFLSIEVTAAFDRRGVLDAVYQAGARAICRAYLTTVNGQSFHHALPGTALGLSRYRLDLILFERAADVGSDCRDGVVVKSVSGNLQDGFGVHTAQGTFTGRMVLAAYGKKSALEKSSAIGGSSRSPFVAFKAHYRGFDSADRIELHAFDGGYCGLSAIESGQVNLCWIGHERVLQGDRALPPALYRNPVLADRLAQLERVPGSLNGLSQISLNRRPKFDRDICQLGDTAGMITPLCGDGMAMALRSAELAVPLVLEFLARERSGLAFKRGYEIAWNREFGMRLRLGKWMHQAFIQPGIVDLSVGLCNRIPGVGSWMIQATRGTATIVEKTLLTTR